MTSIINKRKKGLIYGEAIGDALGLGCEFLTKEQIKLYYPDGFNSYSQIIRDDHRSRWDDGAWTDDTEQFLCLLDSFQDNNNSFDLNDIASRLLKWSKEEGMGIGKLTNNVFKLPQYDKYPQKCAELAWKMTQRKAAPNGALMRNGVISLAYYNDIEKALYYSEEVCKLTHFDPRCIDSCKIHTVLLVSILNDEYLELDEVLKRSNLKDERTIEFIQQNFGPDLSKFKLDNQKSLGYTFKALLCVLWGYYYAESFEDGLLKIINEGGDADTNGCVVGTVLGAKFFNEVIESKILDPLNINKLNQNIEKLIR